MPDRLQPNLTIPQGQLAPCPDELTGDPQQGKPEQLLQAHAEDAATYHGCRINHAALVHSLCQQQGVTINGAEPSVICSGK